MVAARAEVATGGFPTSRTPRLRDAKHLPDRARQPHAPRESPSGPKGGVDCRWRFASGCQVQ
jgi:hypothetical protein